jgi:hypothetical protein
MFTCRLLRGWQSPELIYMYVVCNLLKLAQLLGQLGVFFTSVSQCYHTSQCDKLSSCSRPDQVSVQ